MRRALNVLAVSFALILGGSTLAVSDPIDCPPGQAATLNPSDGGWVCVNQGGNTNNSEDPKNPNKDKGDFQH